MSSPEGGRLCDTVASIEKTAQLSEGGGRKARSTKRVWGRLLRVFAVLVVLALTLELLNPAVTQLALAASNVQTPPADVGSSTQALPADASSPAPSPPQAEIPPGSVTSSNDLPPPTSPLSPQPVEITGDPSTGFTVSTGYGVFVVNRSTAFTTSLILRGDVLLQQTFTVALGRSNLILAPGDGTLTRLPSGFLATYPLLNAGSGIGQMQVYYNFTEDTDKITAIFQPFKGPSSLYSVLWLGFSPLPYVTTSSLGESDTEFGTVGQPGFYDMTPMRLLSTSLGTLKEIGYQDGSVSLRPVHLAPFSVRMGFADAASQYNGTFANAGGSLTYAGLEGNVVAVSFAPGELSIDPELVVSGESSSYLQNSVQRKVVSDGSVYWIFYLRLGRIQYAYSMPVATGSPPYAGWTTVGPVPATVDSSMTSFTVVHFGRTINILWGSGSSPSSQTKIMMVEGVISDDVGYPHITWHSVQAGVTTPDTILDVTQIMYRTGASPSAYCGPPPLGSCGATIVAPIVATYSASGQLVFTYVVSVWSGNIWIRLGMIDRLACANVFCSPSGSALSETETNVPMGNWDDGNGRQAFAIQGMLPVPYQVAGAGIATFMYAVKDLFSSGTQPDILLYAEYVNAGTSGGWCTTDFAFDVPSFYGLPSDFDPTQHMTASWTGSQVEMFYASSDPSYPLGAITFQPGYTPWGGNLGQASCNGLIDNAAKSGFVSQGNYNEPYELTASTEWDGSSVDLFYTQQTTWGQGRGQTTANIIYNLRVIPQQAAILSNPPWAFGGSLLDPVHLTTMDLSGHYEFGAFEILAGGTYTLYAFQFPTPTDFNAGPNDPWVQLPGGPSVDEQGGSINPSSGVLRYQLPLVSTPIRRGVEALSLVYVEPGVFLGQPTPGGGPVQAPSPSGYGFNQYGYFIADTIFLDLPWFDVGRNLLHLNGLYTYDVVWNLAPSQSGGLYWFNNTRGLRFNFEHTAGGTYVLFTAMGETYDFNADGSIDKVFTDSTGGTYLKFNYDATPKLINIVPNYVSASLKGPQISINYRADCPLEISSINYEGGPWSGTPAGKTIAFGYPGQQSCGDPLGGPQTMTVTDALGRVTTFAQTGYDRLESVTLPTGGRINYTYLNNVQWGTETDTYGGNLYTSPVGTVVVYNETGTNRIARQIQLNYHFQNQAVAETDVLVANAAGVWQGSTEYRFQADRGMTSVRTIDSSSQAAYYDMQTTYTCGTSTCMKDLSGNGNGAPISGTTTGFGRWGNGQSFSGVSKISAPASTSLLPKYDLTITGWFKTASLGNYWAVSNWRSSGCTSTACSYLLAPSYGAAAPYYPAVWFYSGSAGAALVGTQTIPTNTWIFIAATFSQGKATLYVSDGAHLANPYTTTMSFTTLNTASTLATTLGSASDSSWGQYAGYMDEVRIYGRALSSDEVMSLYNENVIQDKLTQSWWSANAQPHVVDEFNGYGLASPSATSMDYVDDWGNTIYTRDAYGNEKFASYNNTNHQGEFYAPARLDKMSSGLVYSNNFDYGVNDFDVLTQTGNPAANLDYGYFGRYAPSMSIAMTTNPSDFVMRKAISVTGAPTATFRFSMTPTISGNILQFSFVNSGGSLVWGVRLNGGTAYMLTPGPTLCGYYSSYTWTTVALQQFGSYVYLFLNGVQACSVLYSVPSYSSIQFEVSTSISGGVATWIDDIAVTQGLALVNVYGLQKGQVVQMVAPDGTILGTVEENTQSPLQIFDSAPPLGSFNAVAIGDATILVYATDGSLEYVSPRTDFYAGDSYTFVPSRTTNGRFVKTRTGFDYYTSPMLLNEPSDMVAGSVPHCADTSIGPLGTQCSWTTTDAWTSAYGLPTTAGTQQSHVLGWTDGMQQQWIDHMPNTYSIPTLVANNQYLVNYLYIPTSGTVASSRSPLGIILGTASSSGSNFVAAGWGSTMTNTGGGYGSGLPGSVKPMGGLPVTGQQGTLFKFITSFQDLFGSSGGYLYGYYYQIDGGQAYADGTSIGASDTGSLTITNIPAGQYVELTWANNNTIIPNTIVQSNGGPVVVPLYPTLSVFPVSVKIWVFRWNNYQDLAYYTSAPVTLWGGDEFNYIGASSQWYDVGLVSTFNNYIRLPLNQHNSLMGTWNPHGDCSDAVLCYDMETIRTSSDIQNLDGSAWDTTNDLADISGHGNHGTLQQAVNGLRLDSLANSASGLGLRFDGSQNYISVANPTQWLAGSLTISLWIDPSNVGTARLNPIDKNYGGEFAVTIETTGLVHMYWGQSTSNYIGLTALPDGTVVNGRLQHIALVRNASNNTFIAYYNGAPVGSWQSYSLAAASTSSPIYLARGYTGAYLQGSMDNVLVYAAALSPTQIRGLFLSRLPNAAASFVHLTARGLPDRVRTALNGAYTETTYTYDASGQMLSSALNGNTTYYDYSAFYGGAFPTYTKRPDNQYSFTSYDPYTGKDIGTLTTDCRRIREARDTANRVTQTAYYDYDSNNALMLDMETTYAMSPTAWSFRDVSCHNALGSITTSGTLGPAQAVYGPNGLSGMAQNFDGGSYIAVPSDYLPLGGAARTLSAWVNVATYPGSNDAFVEAYGTTAAQGASFSLAIDPSGYLNADVNNGRATSTLVVPRNEWHFVAVTYGGSGSQVTLFMDGQSQTVSITYGGNPVTPNTASGTFYVGRWTGGGLTFTGAIDDVRVFSSALSTANLLNLVQGAYKRVTLTTSAYDDTAFPSATTFSGDSIPRSLYYDMSTMKGGQVNTLEDLSGNGHAGILRNSNSTSGLPGMGNARTFTGKRDALTAKGYSLSATGFSVSFWVKPTTLTSTQYGYIFSQGQAPYGEAGFCAITPGSVLKLWCVLWNSGGSYAGVLTPTAMSVNTWYYYTITFDGAVFAVYMNGSPVGSAAFTGSPVPMSPTVPLVIGNRFDSGLPANATIDEFQVVPAALTTSKAMRLYNGYGYPPPGSPTNYPSGNTATTTDCLGDATSVTGSWTNPTYAYSASDGGLSATAAPGNGKLYCNEWNTFGFNVPDGVQITSVKVTTSYKLSKNTIAAHLHVGLLTSNGGTNCAVQQDTSRPTTLTAVTFDFTSCKSWSPADFNANAIKVDVGAHQAAGGSLTFSLDYVRIQVTYLTPATSFDPSHATRTYFDGLGRSVRQLTADFYGHALTTAQTLGWNDQPVYSFMTNGQYSTFSYDFVGIDRMVVGPQVNGISSITRKNLYASFLQVQTLDPLGRLSFVQTDLLGRVAYDGVNNPSLGGGFPAAFNYTVTTYNALGLTTQVRTYHGATNDWTFTNYYNAADKLVNALDPNGNARVQTYDKDLRLSSATDANGTIMTYSYTDASTVMGAGMGWISEISVKAKPPATVCYATVYSYDVQDNPYRITNGTASSCAPNAPLSSTAVTVTRTFDGMHRMTSEQISTNGGPSLMTGYGYDNASRLTNLSYPQNQGTAGYVYDTLGRAVQVTWNGTTPYAQMSYDSAGRLINVTYPQSGSWRMLVQYDAMDRPTQQVLCPYTSTAGCSLWLSGYVYDAASQLIQVTNDNMGVGGSGRSYTYGYDGNGRLVSAVGPFSTKPLASGDTQAAYLNYSYDAYGFILRKQDSDLGSCSTGCLWSTAQTVNYAYGAYYDQVGSSTGPGAATESFTYNLDGSMTGRTGFGYVFDLSQRLVKVTSGSTSFTYTYDGTGRRVKEVDVAGGTFTTYYAYNGESLTYTANGSRTSAYVYSGNLLLFRKDSGASSTYHYYLQDFSGNVREVWSYNGNLVVEGKFRYKPFGETATVLVSPSTDPRFRFASQDLSTSTRLYHMGARYYAPDLGRFISRDPALAHDYSYAQNNPVSYTDPSGRFWFLLFIAVVLIAGAISLGTYAATCGSSCSTPGYVGAFLGGAAAGAIGYFTAGAGLGWAVLGGAAANAAAYSIQGALTGTFTWEGLAVAAFTGAILGAVGYGLGKLAGEGSVAAADELASTRTADSSMITRGLDDEGYSSFRAFKKDYGPAGEGLEWHHIVGQTEGNVEKFGADAIHNPQNIVGIERSVHIQISAYYSSKIEEISGDLTIRQWLAGQTFQQQYEFGLQVLGKALAGLL